MILPGKLSGRLQRRVFNKPKPSNLPTVFHICHHKTGSQWIKEVLYQSSWRRVVGPQIQTKHVSPGSIQQGLIYATVYFRRDQFDELIATCPEIKYKTFIVIRDLRDTLVSLYFSLKYSHKVVSTDVAEHRNILKDVDDEQGMTHLIKNGLMIQNDIQVSWLDGDAPIYKYEDLIMNEHRYISEILDICDITLSDKERKSIISKNSFKQMSGGRERGVEDISRHQRKGISGDWKNYFTDRVKDEFKESFAQTLIKTGYEVDDEW